MKTLAKISRAVLVCSLCGMLMSFFSTGFYGRDNLKFPYKKSGLTERQAAAHLLNRFTYGATPGQVDEVVKMGLEKWFAEQLAADEPDDSLEHKLSAYSSLNLTNAEVLNTYPPGFVVVHYAIADSAISKDSVDKAVDKKAYNDQIQAYMKLKGFKPGQDLYKEFISENILRAVYTHNQLKEVLTDFWFNHFNVSFTKGECAQFIPAYERDVIRPNSMGNFDKLVLATAKSPAMLYFLDNFTSQGAAVPPKDKMVASGNQMGATPATTENTMGMMMGDVAPKPVVKPAPSKNIAGLNENFAREVMELHTLGVDGGYTQSDVTQAARILTGWTIYPISSYGYGSPMKGLVDKTGEANLEKKGFVHEGDFLYTPNRHDQGEKTVLGVHFAANGGYQEGVELLEMLAHHPSAAKFISRKLAVRFVSDAPPQKLIDKMAKTFTASNGDIKQVLITMVNAKEFWEPKALQQKTKSPFELAVSAVRGLNADVTQPYQLFNWINKMGQKIYYYQAPTGFPDRGAYWINTGALLNRMNFGLALTSGKIPGVSIDLAELNHGREPESVKDALLTYSTIVMPERDLRKTIQQLDPLLSAPDVGAKVEAAVKSSAPVQKQPASTAFTGMDAVSAGEEPSKKDPVTAPRSTAKLPVAKNATPAMLAQVVGIIIGSPEFQRR